MTDRAAEEFRARLIELSARDQGTDTRDELLALRDLLAQARQAGVDTRPILVEVAALSSDVDRYGMGSMRTILLRCAESQVVRRFRTRASGGQAGRPRRMTA